MPRPVAIQQARGPYERVAASLRDDIRAGRLKPGDQLPTVAELAVAHTVAVGTAHRAMALLKDEHLIEVTRGRRATVAADPFQTTAVATMLPATDAQGRS